MQAEHLKKRINFELWLEKRQNETREFEAIILSLRCALRVMPLTVGGFLEKREAGILAKLIYVTLRCTVLVRSISILQVSPNKQILDSAAYAAHSVAGIAGSASYLLSGEYSAAFHARSSAFSAAFSAFSVDGSGYVGSASNSIFCVEYAESDAIWRATNSDASVIETSGHRALLYMPLWPANAPRPDGLANPEPLRAAFRAATNGHVWLRWYDRMLCGARVSDEEEMLYAHEDLLPLWKKEDGYLEVSAWMAEKLEELDARENSASLEALETEKITLELGTGASVVVVEGQAQLVPVADATDAAIADEPLARQLHAQVLEALQDFVDQARRTSNKEGWKGFDKAAIDYEQLIKSGLVEISQNVVRLWTLTVKLGSYINQDDELRAGNGSFAEPLDSDTRRTLLDVLMPAAPLVRRFPTGNMLDEENLRFNMPQDKVQVAITLIQSAQQSEVLAGPSADLLVDAHETGAKPGPQGAKSRNWARRMTISFVFALGIGIGAAAKGFVGGAAQKAGERFADKSIAVGRFVDFLLKEEAKIIELTDGLPPDIKAKIVEMLRRIREEQLPAK